MKRKLLTLFLALSLLLALVGGGCKGRALPDGFDTDAVKESAMRVVDLTNAGDYAGVVALLRADLTSAVSAEELKTAWGATLSRVGAFESVKKTVLAGTADQATGESYAVCVVICTHEKGDVQYTLSFDKELMLVGLYLK